MKKTYTALLLFIFTCSIFAQEALKSTEEEYYDFLSLTGIVERPTLGYRTLSDSVWNYNEVTSLEENDDGSFTKVRVAGQEASGNIWKQNNLGTNYTLWQAQSSSENFFTRGLKQGLFVRIYGPEWYNSYNTEAPFGQNDGALWQGRGYNTSLTTGLRLEGYGFELTFKPQISWSQNKEFNINKDIYPNKYSYSFKSGTVNHQIDIVQRYGDNSFWNYDWGDSEIRWSWHTLTMGFGTQNPWLGPAYLNPMLGSNNAPGYLKLDAGLRKTELILPFLGWSLGYIEGRIWLGKLSESEYFDKKEDNNERMLTGLSASYNPSFIPGFTIGLNRIFMTYWKSENLKYLGRLFTTSTSNALSSSGNDEDQKFSIFADWVFPKVGFEIYGEFGRDDFSSDEESNPFHTAIYTVGVKQSIPLNFTKLIPALPDFFEMKSELNLEWNNFEMSQDYHFKNPYMGYYSHGFVRQGYTNKGQLLGAAYGSFGNSQFIQYKILYSKGYTSFLFHRYCPNINSIYSQTINASAGKEKKELAHKWYANWETIIYSGFETCYFITNNMELSLAYYKIKIYDSYNNCPDNKQFICNLKYTF